MLIGETVGPYLVLEKLGEGGMGEVYRARDVRLDREVALKRLSDPELAGDVARRRVLNEARAAGALTHPNIAAIHDVLETPEGLVIVMEYVAGTSLAARLVHGPIPVDESLTIAQQIADALGEAHERGIVHRDLKSANILIDASGRAKILDFGIARSVAPKADHAGSTSYVPTEAGLIVGTPGYMAPEQLAGGRADQRTDIYGVGVLLFEMLTGRRPFEARDCVGQALEVFEGRTPRVSEFAPRVPAEISAIVSRAMAKRPEDRYADARELSGALAQALHDLSTAKTSTFEPLPTRPWWRSGAAAGAVMVLLLVAAAVLTRARWWPASPAPRPAVIGVLPFRNESGNAEDAALVVGLSDAVSKRLAAIRPLRVLPLEETREAARDQPDASKVARALGAGYVVDGALRRAGDRLTVTATLVRDNGAKHTLGQFDGTVEKLLELHRAVAEGLVAALAREGVVPAASVTASATPTTNPEAYADYAQARTFLERPDVPGSLDRAITLFQSAIKKDERFVPAYAGLGEAYWAQYNETKDPSWTVKAQAANVDALVRDPAQPEVRMALAVMYHRLGRATQATEELQRVLEEQPSNDGAHLLLSRIHAERSEWDAAVEEARRAIALRPNYWSNHAALGDALLYSGRFDEAVSAYRRLVELQPDSVRGYQRLGTALQYAGQFDEAVANYRKAAAIGPSYGTYSNLGTTYFWRGDMKNAVTAFERAIELAPNKAEVYANLGDAQRKLGKDELATLNYKKAMALVQEQLLVNGQDPQALASLALYQSKLGEHAPARASIREALALASEDAEVLRVAAIVHTLGGDGAAACSALGAALEHGASAVVVRYTDELAPLKGCPAYDAVFRGLH